MKTIKAWHFCRRDKKRLRTSNGDLLIPKDGEWLKHEGGVKMCYTGLHASKRLIDAFAYASATTICRVELRDIVEEGEDKLVARERRVLWSIDGEEVLRAFARRCALDVIDEWDAPEVVLQWLKTGDEQYQDAAGSAAGSAARSAAGSAAGSAARTTQNRRLTSMVMAEHKKQERRENS